MALMKLHRTTRSPLPGKQGESLTLDERGMRLLRELDRIICDRNMGRSQPDSTFDEIDVWFDDGQYWSNSYATRWNVAATLYYLATHPDAGYFGDALAASLDYRDNWSQWSEDKQGMLKGAVYKLWRWLLDQPPGMHVSRESCSSWRRTFAGRYFEFARELGFLEEDYFDPLFKPDAGANRFHYDCLFVIEYHDRILDPQHEWASYVPDQRTIAEHLAAGFFEFPQLEEISSAAEAYVAWDPSSGKLISR